MLKPVTMHRFSAAVACRTFLFTVALVACDGTDASAEQVRAGMAWVFDRYVTDRSLYAVQDAARAAEPGSVGRS